jgi:Zn-dependent peptidase ImmA (M78 family)
MSLILSQIIKRKLPGWNELVFTLDDFDLIAERMQVRVIETASARANGEYLVYQGKPFIVFREGLKRSVKLWVAYHELGHHLLHYPASHRFSRGTWRKYDREANYFAAIALIPTKLIAEMPLSEIQEQLGYDNKLIGVRKEIYEAYRI